ncbi:MAG: glutathione S-transferase family protein [Alphaproteobacteria bacterium]
MTITLYGSSLSPFVRKVRIVLAEKGLDYTLDQVNVFNPPDWFLAISPLKRIPVLKDGHATLPDSSAICGYLEKRSPDPALYPRVPFDFGRALWFEEYADSEFAGAIGLGCFRPVVVSRLMGKEPDHAAARKTCEERLPRYLAYLEGEITGRTHFVGEALSIADIAVASQLVNLRHTGYMAAAGTYPSLTAHFQRMLARPSFAACLAEEQALLSKFGVTA